VDAGNNPVSIDQFAGARLEFDAIRGEETNLTVGATYYAAGLGTNQNFRFGTLNPQNVNPRPIDRLDVFGADIKAKFAGFNIGVEYAQSDFLRDTNRVLSRTTGRWMRTSATTSVRTSESRQATVRCARTSPRRAHGGASATCITRPTCAASTRASTTPPPKT
jgi:hypothetical protein